MQQVGPTRWGSKHVPNCQLHATMAGESACSKFEVGVDRDHPSKASDTCTALICPNHKHLRLWPAAMPAAHMRGGAVVGADVATCMAYFCRQPLVVTCWALKENNRGCRRPVCCVTHTSVAKLCFGICVSLSTFVGQDRLVRVRVRDCKTCCSEQGTPLMYAARMN